MALVKIFQMPKQKRDPVTGKKVDVMNPATGDPVMLPLWRVRIEKHGRRHNIRLSRNKAEAQKMADGLVMRQAGIKAGLVPMPTPERKTARRTFWDVVEEYLEWGNTKGGRKKHPWSATHARDRRSVLSWWMDRLNLKALADVEDCLPHVEKALAELRNTGREHPRQKRRTGGNPLTGKTLNEYASALKAFCQWCTHRSRRYLTHNPLDGFENFDSMPSFVRRELEQIELTALLDTAPLYLRLLFETALCSGLRRGELRALTLDHLSRAKSTLRIDANRDKARERRHQILPMRLLEPLLEFARSGEPERLYALHYRGEKAKELAIPEKPLLFVPVHTARALKRVALRAGVEIENGEGKIDFHALRTAYINMLIASGADPKTVMELSRHATASVTFKHYGRANAGRMTQAAEAVGEIVLGGENAQITPRQESDTL